MKAIIYTPNILVHMWRSEGKMMRVSDFSKRYEIRKLCSADIEEIYSLCRTNPLYYKFCPPNVTRESIMEDLTALPSNISMRKNTILVILNQER